MLMAGIQQPRMAENLNAFAPEDLLEFPRGIFIEIAQQLRTALDDRDLDAEARKELRKLNRHRAAAQDDERFGWRLQLESIVTRQIADFLQVRQRRWRDNRSRADHKMRGVQPPAGAQGNRVLIHKPRLGSDERKAPIRKLLVPIISKFLD